MSHRRVLYKIHSTRIGKSDLTHIGRHATRVVRLPASCFTGSTGADMTIDAKAAKLKAVNSDFM